MKITSKWIRTKFERRRGDDPYSRLWEELPLGSRTLLLRGVVLETQEVPVCAITALPNPVVITTRHLVWRVGESPHSLRLNELASCQPPSLPMSKLDMSKVVVKTHSGKEHLIETAPGKTLFVLWNVLLQFARPRASSHGMEN